MIVNKDNLKRFLDEKVEAYNNPSFIADDPISIPHRFEKKQDVEIMGFFAATLAWGQRPTIISKCFNLAERMDNAPHDFITNHSSADLQKLIGFCHRTFNDTDLLAFIDFLTRHYRQHDSLEDAFMNDGRFISTEDSLIGFERYFFASPDMPQRTRKHVATPARKSACKRLNMFLRWMVRDDDKGVDFGLWRRIRPADLICPIDVHVDRTARKIGLITRKQTDWQTALELTANLRQMDADDPVKYDFALFGLSIGLEPDTER